VDDALFSWPRGKTVMPNSRQFSSSASSWRREMGSVMGWTKDRWHVVIGRGQGEIGRRTVRELSRKPSNA